MTSKILVSDVFSLSMEQKRNKIWYKFSLLTSKMFVSDIFLFDKQNACQRRNFLINFRYWQAKCLSVIPLLFDKQNACQRRNKIRKIRHWQAFFLSNRKRFYHWQAFCLSITKIYKKILSLFSYLLILWQAKILSKTKYNEINRKRMVLFLGLTSKMLVSNVFDLLTIKMLVSDIFFLIDKQKACQRSKKTK